MAGCFAPINLTYDSAKTLDKGQIQVKGNYSRYNVMEKTVNDTSYSGLINENFGFSIGYGISDKFTMSAKYEYMKPTITFQKIFGEISEDFNGMNSMSYFEIDNKLNLVENNLAISLPLGAYFYNTKVLEQAKGGMGWFSFDPRLYVTFFRKTNIFELSIIPKLHILFGSFGGYVQPAISLGMGFSSNLDRWAIRPEIGLDQYFSFGVGANFNFNTIKPTSSGSPKTK
jgi:hypothetical protein